MKQFISYNILFYAAYTLYRKWGLTRDIPVVAASAFLSIYFMLMFGITTVSLRHLGYIESTWILNLEIHPALPEKINQGWPAIAILLCHYSYYKLGDRWISIINFYQSYYSDNPDIPYAIAILIFLAPILIAFFINL